MNTYIYVIKSGVGSTSERLCGAAVPMILQWGFVMAYVIVPNSSLLETTIHKQSAHWDFFTPLTLINCNSRRFNYFSLSFSCHGNCLVCYNAVFWLLKQFYCGIWLPCTRVVTCYVCIGELLETGSMISNVTGFHIYELWPRPRNK